MNHLTKMFDGQQLRIVERNNEPWFVAKDVCDILELSNVTRSISRLNDKQKGLHTVNTPGGQQQLTVINESGVYKLVFTSRKPEAEKFTDWISEEVIPSIRKHGAYATPQTIENIISDPDFGIKLLTTLKEEKDKRIQAERIIEQQKPLVSFAEICMASNKSILIRELAKLASKQGIITGEKRLWQKLRDWKLVFQNKNEPYQEYIDRGYFEIAQGVKETDKGSFTWQTMRVTPKGQKYIVNRLKKENEQLRLVK